MSITNLNDGLIFQIVVQKLAMLIKYFDLLRTEVKHRLGKIASERTKQYRGIERLPHYFNEITRLFHEYRKATIYFNPFIRV